MRGYDGLRSLRDELNKLGSQYQKLVENEPDIVARFDKDFRHLFVNPAVEKATGIPARHFIGKTNRDLGMPEELCALWESNLREVFRSGQTRFVEFSLPLAGGVRHFQSRLIPENFRGGQVETVLSIARDVSELRQTEQTLQQRVAEVEHLISSMRQLEHELRRGEELFRHTFDNAPIGMALVGLDGRWLQVNRSMCEIVGYPADDLLALTFQDITHPDDLDADLAQVRQVIAGEIRQYSMEKRYFRKTGELVWVLLSVALVHDASGRPLHFISQVQDITQSKQMAQERDGLVAKLQETLAAVKTLERLLPVCAWCKQVRNSDGEWKTFEEHVQASLDVNITHGICPDCLGRHLPKTNQPPRR